MSDLLPFSTNLNEDGSNNLKLQIGTHSLIQMNKQSNQYILASVSSGSGSKLSVVTNNNNQNVDLTNQTFLCVDRIEKVEVSPDGTLIMCGLFARNTIQIFSLDPSNKDWKCRISEGIAGMLNAVWCPCSTRIITESDFGIHLCVWSLANTSNTMSIISNPKPSSTPIYGLGSLYCFSPCGTLFSVVHRIELQDHIALFSIGSTNMEEIVKFKARSSDIASLQWCAPSMHLVTVDSPLTYKCCVYTPAGEMLCCFEAYQNALGVRSLGLPSVPSVTSSNPISLVMAIGSFDGKVRVLSLHSWQLVFTLPLGVPDDNIGSEQLIPLVETIPNALDSSIINEPIKKNKISQIVSPTPLSTTQSYHASRKVKTLPKIAATTTNKEGLPNMGVSWLSFDSTGSLLATREDNYPKCLWIYNPLTAKLISLIVQLEGILCARWRPQGSSAAVLAFCTGTSKVYFWRPSSMSVSGGEITSTDVSSYSTSTSTVKIGISSIQWSADGTHILLRGKEAFVACRYSSQEVNLTTNDLLDNNVENEEVNVSKHVFLTNKVI